MRGTSTTYWSYRHYCCRLLYCSSGVPYYSTFGASIPPPHRLPLVSPCWVSPPTFSLSLRGRLSRAARISRLNRKPFATLGKKSGIPSGRQSRPSGIMQNIGGPGRLGATLRTSCGTCFPKAPLPLYFTHYTTYIPLHNYRRLSKPPHWISGASHGHSMRLSIKPSAQLP